jgi:hypothetical protein
LIIIINLKVKFEKKESSISKKGGGEGIKINSVKKI